MMFEVRAKSSVLVEAEHLLSRRFPDDELDALEVGGQVPVLFEIAENGLFDDALDVGPISTLDLDVFGLDQEQALARERNVLDCGAMLDGRPREEELCL